MKTYIHASGRRRKFAPRCKPFFLWTLLLAAAAAYARPEIASFTGVIEGHQVGGVTIDLVGNIYVADFGDLVWKITPEGERQVFASGLYGAPTASGADTSSVVTGLFYGGGLTQLGKQALGSGATVAATLAVSLVMMFALKRVGVLRVSKAGEIEGLDISEHGASAYPEHALAAALGIRDENPAAVPVVGDD